MNREKTLFFVLCIAAVASLIWFHQRSNDSIKKERIKSSGNISRHNFQGRPLVNFSGVDFQGRSLVNVSRHNFQGWPLVNFSGVDFRGRSLVNVKHFQGRSLVNFSEVDFHGRSLVNFSWADFQGRTEKHASIYMYINHGVKYNPNRTAQLHDRYHEILWWNVPKWMNKSGQNTHCKFKYCEFSNCKLTTDQKQANESSAIIISISKNEKHSIHVSRLNRNPNQIWIFFSMEPPVHYNYAFLRNEKSHYVFNWSMTYHRDADIFLPYSFLRQREEPPDRNYVEIFRKKTRQVAWIVSHCSTQGKREDYIKKLRKYIPVDTYGRCGKKLPDEDLFAILPEYKFYLGFENSLCRDYVTEKFFRYFQYDIIVVVRGFLDYNKHLPNNTFINSANFASIESLGKYLVRIGSNEMEYIEYLRNKDQYTVVQTEKYCDALCTICERLNNKNQYKRSYGNILDFTGPCVSPKDLH